MAGGGSEELGRDSVAHLIDGSDGGGVCEEVEGGVFCGRVAAFRVVVGFA